MRIIGAPVYGRDVNSDDYKWVIASKEELSHVLISINDLRDVWASGKYRREQEIKTTNGKVLAPSFDDWLQEKGIKL